MRIASYALTAALITVMTTEVLAASVFFGEDSAGGSLPVPNADAARALFLANLEPGIGTEDFESFSNGDTLPLNVMLGSVTATLTGSGTIHDYDGGIFAISPTNHLATSPGFTLTFDAPQVAFGFYGTDIGDFGGQLSLSFGGGGGVLVPHTIGAGGSTNGDAFFYGIIDTDNPFSSVEFLNSDASDQFGFDNFTIGDVSQVVPEPGSMALFGIGLVGLVGRRRRRRAAKTSA